MSGRMRVLAGVILIAVAAGAIGYWFGGRLRSPEDIAAATAEPEASPITVPVETRTLSRDVITRVTAAFTDSVDLTLNPSQGLGTTPVVTGRVPALGDLLSEGQVGIEVAGRPVFVLGGDLPSFRSMGPGTNGVDVLQLETSLARLGHFTEVPDEEFDEATEAGIEALYVSAGYDPPALSESDKGELERAAENIDTAEDDLERAQEQLADAVTEPSESSVLQQGQGLVSARRNVADAEYAVLQLGIADPELDRLELDEQAALRALEDVSALLSSAQADPDRFPAEQIESLEEETRLRVSAYDDAKAAIVGYHNDRTDRLRAANARLVGARESLAIEEARVREANEPPDLTSVNRGVENAMEALDERKAELAELEAEIGTSLPQSEFLFLKNLPRIVSRVDIEPGELVNGAVMRISGAEVELSGGIPQVSRPFVELGSTAIVDDSSLGIELETTITELADDAGTNGEASSRFYFEVTPTGIFDPEELVRIENFRITIPIERTEGEVLAVPLAALSASADGSARVEILQADGSTELITVTVGLEAGGFAEITPVGVELVAGEDLVVIGYDRGGTGGSDDAGS